MPKTKLTPAEKITAAYLHVCMGTPQQEIAIAMGGINLGRVNEAIKAIEKAAGLSSDGGYKTRRGK